MTYLAYVALFDTLSDAIKFENRVLSIGRQYLPPCARDVLDGNAAAPEYWTWLASQRSTVQALPVPQSASSSTPKQTAQTATPAPTRFGLLEIE